MAMQTIDPPTLKRWLDQQEAIVIDVRQPAEYAAEKIAGAQLIPLGTLCKQGLPDSGDKKIVVYCRSGMRGNSACQKLLAEDPRLEIYQLEGGITAWIKAGYPVETSGKFFLPLDRQVQLTIGSMVLFGSALTYWVHPLFILVPAFFGLGLSFAGITGFCGLALLMAKMPWNQSKGSSAASSNSSCCS